MTEKVLRRFEMIIQGRKRNSLISFAYSYLSFDGSASTIQLSEFPWINGLLNVVNTRNI